LRGPRPNQLGRAEPPAKAIREIAKLPQAAPCLLRLDERPHPLENLPEAVLELVLFEESLAKPSENGTGWSSACVVDPLDGLKGEGLRSQLQADAQDPFDG